VKIPEPVIPGDIPPAELPALLRNWHLGSKARRHLSRRRFYEVTSLLDRSGGRALDAGCGWGYGLFLLGRRGFEPFGIDIVQDDFPAARRVASANALDVALAGADLGALPFVEGSFAAMTAVETIEHVFEEDRMSALREAWRVLVPGGVLALSTPNERSIVERGKRLIVRFPLLKRLFPPMCYPAGAVPRESYHPYSYHKPVPPEALRRMLEDAGFEVAAVKTVIFVWKSVPDALFAAARLVETALERAPFVRSLASTLVVSAIKVERSAYALSGSREQKSSGRAAAQDSNNCK
jgi:2-polyprenyl-3-methyl-5-hydroxy-6-metoxy-1,4-benzoquinol methylase